MKKLIPFIMAAFLLVSFTPTQLDARTRTRPVTLSQTNAASPDNSNSLLTRLSEIRAMDFSDLNRSERKGLRKELRNMKSDLNAIGGTVYISAGALILIVILLILLL